MGRRARLIPPQSEPAQRATTKINRQIALRAKHIKLSDVLFLFEGDGGKRITALSSIDEMDMARLRWRRGKAGHHCGVLRIGAIADHPLGGLGLQEVLDFRGKLWRAVEHHA